MIYPELAIDNPNRKKIEQLYYEANARYRNRKIKSSTEIKLKIDLLNAYIDETQPAQKQSILTYIEQIQYITEELIRTANESIPNKTVTTFKEIKDWLKTEYKSIYEKQEEIELKKESTDRSKIISIREIIAELEEKMGKHIPINEIKHKAKEKEITEEEVEEAIEKLKRAGDIFEPQRGHTSAKYDIPYDEEQTSPTQP